MPAQVAIVHGWSDSSNSFHTLRDFLTANGYQTTQIWLSDYVSMDDDVRVEDVGKRIERVIRAAIDAHQLTVPFDLIVHSTGGLVVREWLSRYYPDGQNCPVKRIIMLAPANFGSRLASIGKSMIGRVVKGWNNWLQSGTQMLVGLELASAYQWNLARRDLLDPNGNGSGPYGPDKVWPFVIVGTRPYPSGMHQIVNENGSDGTVRPAAANLNAVGMTVDFSGDADNPQVTPWRWRSGDAQFPFTVLPDRDHGSIHEPLTASGAQAALSGRLGELILSALGCDAPAAYRAIFTAWSDIAEQTARLSQDDAAMKAAFPHDPPDAEMLHQYLQVVAFVRDDQGQPVNDYFLEFFAPDQSGSDDAVYFHRRVLDHVHVNGQSASQRCLFIDRADLMLGFYPLMRSAKKRQLAVSISAAALGSNIRYFDSTRMGAAGHLVVHDEDETKRAGLTGRLIRNTTNLIEVIIPRQPIDKVFKLTQ